MSNVSRAEAMALISRREAGESLTAVEHSQEALYHANVAVRWSYLSIAFAALAIFLWALVVLLA